MAEHSQNANDDGPPRDPRPAQTAAPHDRRPPSSSAAKTNGTSHPAAATADGAALIAALADEVAADVTDAIPGPLDGLVERAKLDVGVAFEPEVIAEIFQLQRSDSPGYQRLMQGLRVEAKLSAAQMKELRAAARGHAASGAGDSAGAGVRGFTMKNSGLWFSDPDPERPEEQRPARRISGPFEIAGKARDHDNGKWGILLRWRDPDNEMHEWVMPFSKLAGDGAELRAELLDGGLLIEPDPRARDLLFRYLLHTPVTGRVRCVDRSGWHSISGRSAFVLPDGTVYGRVDDERVVLRTARRSGGEKMRQAGTLAEWQTEVATYAIGNDRLAFFVAAAFAGPLLDLLALSSVGFHLFGVSQTGKTTAARAAASVWGQAATHQQIYTWRATANGLEAVASETTDTLLVLDELSEVDAKEAGAVVYMLANQSGKTRAARNGESRERRSWRLVYLSTGEKDLAAKLAEAGTRVQAGQDVRLVPILSDAGAGLGVFQELHSFPNAGELVDHIGRATQQSAYGTAGRAFLERLTGQIEIVSERERLRASLDAAIAEFVEGRIPPDAPGQVRSVARHFGLVAAAGELAARLGVLPWTKGEAIEAASACFDAWLSARGGTEAAEEREALKHVRAFIEAHSSDRFETISRSSDDGTQRVVNRVGFRELTTDGEWVHYVLPEAFANEVCRGLNHNLAARVLARKGLLVRDAGERFTTRRTLHGLGRKRVYAISARILEAGADA